MQVEILETKYEVIDALNNITLADSFLKNKTGKGNGEAKLYVGNESKELSEFFGDFSDLSAFFQKKDLIKVLQDLKEEYYLPQQHYYKKMTKNSVKMDVDITEEMPSRWEELFSKVSKCPKFLNFKFSRSNVKPPRVYINSDAKGYYTLLREIAIPNISYLSILKLKEVGNGKKIIYYFKPFIDYSNTIQGYQITTFEEEKALKKIAETTLSTKKKETLKTARIGQGKYRELLLEDMPYCPFTKVSDERLLIASHMKPWVKSDEHEKIDPKNGLILTPTYDALFDKGFISFHDNGKLIVSPFLSPLNQKRLNINDGKQIDIQRFLDSKRLVYLSYHRDNIFKGI